MGFFDFFTDRTPAEPAEIRLVAHVRGKVQGVGFRWWCAGTAKPLGLTGYAENLDDGRVKVIAEGTAASCARLVDILHGGDTSLFRELLPYAPSWHRIRKIFRNANDGIRCDAEL